MKSKKIYRATKKEIDNIQYYLIFYLDWDILEFKFYNTEYDSTVMECICNNTDAVRRWLKYTPLDLIKPIHIWYRLTNHRFGYGFTLFNIT